MNKQPRKFQAPMVGGSSLLVIFAVLCLTIFALLGFCTAQADQRLAEASIRAVSGYYAADGQAERILAQLRNGETVEGVTVENDVYHYNCAISDTQVLMVEARVTDRDHWQVLRWQAVSTAQWDEEELLTVWSGDSSMDNQ